MMTLARPPDRAEITRRLRTVRPQSAARWGRMSAHQMICHVGDALCMACGEKRVSPASGLLQRTIVKWTALYLPVPWPAGILTRPEIDQEAGGTRPADFASDVARVESLLERIATEPTIMISAHPIFGRMSQRAWLRWAYVHTDHHLRQFGA
jgi:hypothetical protein